jgi:hypothetical protein
MHAWCLHPFLEALAALVLVPTFFLALVLVLRFWSVRSTAQQCQIDASTRGWHIN